MRINNKYIYQIILNYLLSYITLGLPRNTSTEGTPSGTWIFRDGRNPLGLPRLFPERVIGNPSHTDLFRKKWWPPEHPPPCDARHVERHQVCSVFCRALYQTCVIVFCKEYFSIKFQHYEDMLTVKIWF